MPQVLTGGDPRSPAKKGNSGSVISLMDLSPQLAGVLETPGEQWTTKVHKAVAAGGTLTAVVQDSTKLLSIPHMQEIVQGYLQKVKTLDQYYDVDEQWKNSLEMHKQLRAASKKTTSNILRHAQFVAKAPKAAETRARARQAQLCIAQSKAKAKAAAEKIRNDNLERKPIYKMSVDEPLLAQVPVMEKTELRTIAAELPCMMKADATPLTDCSQANYQLLTWASCFKTQLKNSTDGRVQQQLQPRAGKEACDSIFSDILKSLRTNIG